MKYSTNDKMCFSSVIFLLMLFISFCSYGETMVAAEYKVKAVFLINFAKFIDWPPEALGDASSEIIIGIIGDDPFKEVIEDVAKKSKVHNRDLVIKRFNNEDDIQFCHILFICSSEKKNLDRIKDKIKDWDVLTVSETEGFAEKGVIINFKTVGSKIRFEINKDAADEAELKVSSQLMKLAILVESKQSGIYLKKKRNRC